MIDLVFSNGEIFTYKVDDWATLRKQHRIIGEIVGNTTNIPSLPVKILPEEATLLLNKEIVSVYEVTNYSSLEKDKIEDFENNLLQHEIIEYKKIRRAQLESVIDKIVEKRRKTGDDSSPEEILNSELEKSTSVTKDNMIWPILMQPLNISEADKKRVASEDILKLTTELKCAVYRDLWEKGYYITQGDKFGGDFLVYFGDPVCHHAIFIVRCVKPEERITPAEIVAFGRLGTSVKKRAVLASVVDDTVSYVTINWIDA
ncbi:tRNA-splicing endonuclease subunit Sen34 [Anoplophora glabripennis]|uniref:tRNA-splicing endonuclease subunit Sen34 n=1 Tax=Anoplophora glabripennis TaxID=217634 RepID=UPI00087375C4|nr:tRNA-splicing endonuclease subunit Sen34 [Anoplophora glabripennis]